MTLKSMTGFGRGEAAAGGVRADAELGSVNRKQLDVRISLPRYLAGLEPRVKELVREALTRGHVTGAVGVSLCGAAQARRVTVDAELARAYLRRLRETASALDAQDDLRASHLLQLPNVVRLDTPPDTSDRIWPVLRRAVKRALAELVAMRRAEGAALGEDIAGRLQAMRRLVRKIAERAPTVKRRHSRTLRTRLDEAGLDGREIEPQILRDLVLFAERSDISEELVRLESHLDQFARLLNSGRPVGRQMDFLCQELFREANTIGSKANDVHIARRVVALKAELESVREQVQNIE